MEKKVNKIVSDGEKSKFEDATLEFDTVEGVSPGGVFEAAGLGPSEVALVSFAADFSCEFHNTPAPTWMLIMTGQMQIELSDDATKTFVAGDILHLSDADGQGHRSTVLGDEEVIVATAGYGG